MSKLSPPGGRDSKQYSLEKEENSFSQKLDQFFAQFDKKQIYKKKEIIVRADDNPPGVFYLKDGYARLYSISPHGQELTLNIFKPGCYFSMMWAIGETQNTYYFEALTRIELWRAPKEALIEFIRKEPEVLFELTRRILIGLDGLLGVMESLLFGNASNKIATVLTIAAKRFGKKRDDGKIIVEMPLTHQTIASLAGLTRETASLVLKQFDKDQLIISKKPYLIVNDMEKLEQETLILKEHRSLPHIY